MIYLVTNQKTLFESKVYKILDIKTSLSILKKWNIIQFDTETLGKDPHVGSLLLIQFGSIDKKVQILVDNTTIDITLYKEILESKYLIGQNLKFDLQWLYNYNIVPLKVYDTMVVEQLLYLGYPPEYKDPINGIAYSLNSIAKRRLDIYIDKTVRGEIQWRGVDDSVVNYAATDVIYLADIMYSQLSDCRKQNCIIGAKLECDFVPVIAYLEWCGIHLDAVKWKEKMKLDNKHLQEAINDLNNFVTSNPELKEFTHVNYQGDLFEGFNLTPKCTINWASSVQVVPLLKKLGFDTRVQDKKTGEDKESAMEKVLKKQKGINDKFLKLYLGKGEPEDDDYYAGYNGSAKVVTSFGQNHLNAINPNTQRIHTVYRQLGCDTGRMSSGAKDNNNDLAKLNHLPISPSNKQKKEGKACPYPNMQQLPADEITRSCFTAPKGYKWCSCDYSAIESRLGADIYQEKSMIDEFLHGSGDMHSLCAYMVYTKEIPRDTPIKDIKKLYPHLRKEVKAVEFSQQLKELLTTILGNLKSKQERIMYKVVINSQELVVFFANNYGLCGKKARTLNPQIKLNWNIMRGLFDGDGSFKKGVVLTTCSESFKNRITKFYDTYGLHYTVTKDSAYRIAIYRKYDVNKVYHLLYDGQTLYLERKKQDLFRLAIK